VFDVVKLLPRLRVEAAKLKGMDISLGDELVERTLEFAAQHADLYDPAMELERWLILIMRLRVKDGQTSSSDSSLSSRRFWS
jgi:hypothetical protein